MDKKQCAECGNEFEGNAKKIYCSDACKQSAYKKAKEVKTEMQPVKRKLYLSDAIKFVESDENDRDGIKLTVNHYFYFSTLLPENSTYSDVVNLIKYNEQNFDLPMRNELNKGRGAIGEAYKEFEQLLFNKEFEILNR